MGKSKGFLEIERKEPEYRPKAERLRDYRAVERQPTKAEIQEQAARCMDCGTPFCHAYGCAVSNLIPEFNEWVYRGRWRQALDLLLSANNFPEFTGRVCPAPCEAACVAGLSTEPVSIRQIELAIIEKGFEDGALSSRPPRRRRSGRVAVIGSGPAGLAVADTLNRAGYGVTVYENAPRPGGILTYGIPDFKLEKWVVERRIRLMEAQGVVFETGVNAGEDISYRYLKKRFDVACLACGAQAPRDLAVPGRDLGGIHFAMDYLTQQNRRIAGEPVAGEDISATGKRVVVIGGGDTGSDCLGTALRQGAERVYQLEILPRPPEKRAEHTPWPQWPVMLRRTHAHKEGGELRWSMMTKEITGQKGRVRKLRCVEVNWQSPGKGLPPQPVEMAGTDFEIDADLVLVAMGFSGPGKNRLVDDLDMEPDDRGNIKTDDGKMTSVEGIFAAGDMAMGQSLVVKAIADGRKAAQGIMAYLKGKH
ncbi:MAG: glutamate synthase subunit beta [Deltaproteobacteria bacterium]|nr:glutamate synthase subunit beta [Deltaproteobacteria bacterium]MBW1815952.1 glutamate synthase subunit beta [Deltaproteobacteria bacterium]MBW2283051.1 glutamate synthase subunit beta [Deltaproteobacteria bacterium]